MSALGLKIIDEAVQQANIWINDVTWRSGLVSKQAAYRMLRAVLQALRDHLTPDEAAQLSAQLPLFVRGLYYEGYNPAHMPRRARSRAEFVAHVAAIHGAPLPEEIEAGIRAVFDVLDAHVSRGEMADVRAAFAADIRALFAD
jgi:uncharacterized protein (DUF2267 family)